MVCTGHGFPSESFDHARAGSSAKSQPDISVSQNLQQIGGQLLVIFNLMNESGDPYSFGQSSGRRH
jgi:hypothetical protein